MRVSIEIENIDELRRCHGIDDIELHEDTPCCAVVAHVGPLDLSAQDKVASALRTATLRSVITEARSRPSQV